MSEYKDEVVTVAPKDGSVFWNVTVEIQEEDPDTGKIKKIKEEHLVDGVSCTEVEKKVREEMDGTMSEWKIVKCQQSKICVVY